MTGSGTTGTSSGTTGTSGSATGAGGGASGGGTGASGAGGGASGAGGGRGGASGSATTGGATSGVTGSATTGSGGASTTSGGGNNGQGGSGQTGGAGGARAGDAGTWTLVWADEFDKDGPVDPQKWNFEIQKPGWVNQELEQYTNRSENARVENGRLIIEARRDSFNGYEYSSARLNSAKKGDLLYGRIEVKAKLPKGTGTWPAIWMMPTDNAYGGWPDSGEVDIMEHVGFDPGVVHGSTHCHNYYWKNNNQKTASTKVPDFGDVEHVYTAEWYPDRIDVFVDGTKYFTSTNDGTGWQSWPFDKRFHVILNIAIGGNWGGTQGVDNSIFPQRMEVDYVRLYQMK